MTDIPDHWIHEETLSPGEVAKIFDVNPRTVSTWADNAIIGFFRTPNGDRRFPKCEVQRIMQAEPAPDFLKAYAAEDKLKYREMWEGGWRRGSRAVRLKEEKEKRDGAA